ncbi:DUF2786 domain-containing protein [Streptomyces globisporus]|uniref:DUF2786 domain-containing protein n=1 Tax=Streptomyces globisporus TaxID=1908 RepID=A0A927BMR5_STRGL|nr:DUF2786 domain-containing protein [Streptomyces globisporus]
MKAEDPAASREESESYFAKAAELMAKYGIEQAMLADANPGRDRPADRVIQVEGGYVVDRIDLLFSILRPLGLQGIRLRGANGKLGAEVHVFGYEADIQRAELLFTSLLLQAFNGMRHGRPMWGESVIAYRKTWLMGFSRAVEDRLEAAEARARGEAVDGANGRSAELVLADRASVVLASYRAAYPKTQGRKRSVVGSGFSAGGRAGNAADLGGTRVGSGGRRGLTA